MKIDSYAVSASSQRVYQSYEYQSLQLTNGQGQNSGGNNTQGIVDRAKEQLGLTRQDESPRGTTVQEYVDRARHRLGLNRDQQGGTARQGSEVSQTGAVTSGPHLPQSKEELKLQMLENFILSLTGRQVNLRMEGFFGRQQGTQRLAPANARGFSLTATQVQYEREAVSYNAQGLIKTADGKTINVDVSMSMSREFASYAQTTLNFAPPQNLVDPLVINYGGTAASLTGEKFAFDLDADGVLDQISFAGAGSGFLALDKNGDGKINDGSELFGPNTGNGFSELRGYDKDGNNWIDENDEIFSKLRIWSKDADGNDQLYTLLELGIGAIYLGDVETQFSMNDQNNNTMGVMRSTSFFLKEDGSGAGTISHIDLKV